MAAQVIAALQQKGGAGKSTMLMSMAGSMARDGAEVLMIDTDPQQNVVSWARKHESDRLSALEILDEKILIPKVEEYHEQFDVILIDTAGYESQMATYVLVVADLVMIPVGTSEGTLKGAMTTLEHVHRVTKAHAHPPAAYLAPWNIKRQTRIAEKLRSLADESGHPVLREQVGDYVGFHDMTWGGELPAGAAGKAIRGFMAELQMRSLLTFYRNDETEAA